MKTRTAILLFSVAAAAPLLADKQTPPAPGKPKGFSVPAPKTFALDNGMGVTLVQYGTVPKVSISLAVRTGNVDEKANEVWLADLTGDLLTEGTTTRSASQIAQDAARMEARSTWPSVKTARRSGATCCPSSVPSSSGSWPTSPRIPSSPRASSHG
jgi:hypothetical protein